MRNITFVFPLLLCAFLFQGTFYAQEHDRSKEKQTREAPKRELISNPGGQKIAEEKAVGPILGYPSSLGIDKIPRNQNRPTIQSIDEAIVAVCAEIRRSRKSDASFDSLKKMKKTLKAKKKQLAREKRDKISKPNLL